MEFQKDRVFWQHSGGDGDRIYCDICFNYEVILNGPGNAGKLNDTTKKKMLDDGIKQRKITDLLRFCFEMKDGDIVILRIGTTKIYGIGTIIGNYEFNNIFSDVDGWNIQHCRRIYWIWKAESNVKPKIFPVNTLKRGDTTQRLTSKMVLNWISSLDLEINKKISVAALPLENKKINSVEDIASYLFEKGLEGNLIKTIVDVLVDLCIIAKWYTATPTHAPSEFETKAYLIIPLLRALGWTPQKMAIEWNKVDIALFDKLPREDRNLIAVVEAKRKGNSCLTAFSQAEKYSKDKPHCNRLIVTDGIRYGIFKKENNQFKLHAYMNLTEFKEKYEIYKCVGIKEALWSMTPDWHYDV